MSESIDFSEIVVPLTEEEQEVQFNFAPGSEVFEPFNRKYIPTTLDDVILDSDIRDMLSGYIKQGVICDLILAGSPGIGKSTLAKCICRTLKVQMLHIDASIDNGIDIIRTRVKDFCNMSLMEGKIKVLVFSEADRLSEQAMDALKDIIDDAGDNTRFIFTCNRLHKIVKAIRSRCTIVTPTYGVKDVQTRVCQIIKKEGISYDNETLSWFINEVIPKEFPDIRSCIKTLENCSITGDLKRVSVNKSLTAINATAERVKSNIKHPLNVRKYLNAEFQGDYEELAIALFNSFTDNVKAMMIIGDMLKHFPHVLDKEVHFTYMLMQLSTI
jgi:DNA polymerase III delta prime subunit